MRSKPLKLKRLENGCIIPTSHKLNKDGYFRYHRPELTKGRKPLVMFHRLVWEKSYGKIPEGYEIDHICRNRACCNIKHLQMLEGSDHAIKGNKIRYTDRKAEAKAYWNNHKDISGTALASLFCVSFSSGCKWIREWKA